MFNTASKRIGWFCLFCVVYLCGWITFNIVAPSLKAPQPTEPVFKIRTGRYGSQHIAFSQDGKQLLCLYTKTTTGGNSIRRWDTLTDKRLTPITSPEALTALSKDGRFYATEDRANRQTLHFYRLSDQKLIGTLPFGATGETLVDIIGHQPLAISIKYDTLPGERKSDHIETSQYFIRDIRSGKLLTPYSPIAKRQSDVIWGPGTAYTPNGPKVLSLYPIYIENVKEKNQQINKQLNGFPVKPRVPIVKIKLFNRISGKQEILPFPQDQYHPNPTFLNSSYQTPQLSDDGNLYAAVSFTSEGSVSDDGQDGSIWCYDLAQKKLRWHYHHEEYFPLMLAFSPDGTMLAASGFDTTYRYNMGFTYVVDTRTGKLIHIFTEQNWKDQVKDRMILAFHQMRYKIMDTINFYRKNKLRIDDSYFHQFAPNDSGIPSALAWSPDSKTLAVSYVDGSVKIWQVKE